MYMYRAITIGPLQGLNALKRYTICNKLKQFVKLSFVCKSATNVGFAFQGKKKANTINVNRGIPISMEHFYLNEN